MRRILLGLLVMFAVGAIADFLVPANSSLGYLLGARGLGLLFSVFVGAIVARKNFLIPVLAVTVIGWLWAAYIAREIASVIEATSILEVMLDNVAGLVMYLAAATIGAISGMWMASRLFDSSNDADNILVDSE